MTEPNEIDAFEQRIVRARNRDRMLCRLLGVAILALSCWLLVEQLYRVAFVAAVVGAGLVIYATRIGRAGEEPDDFDEPDFDESDSAQDLADRSKRLLGRADVLLDKVGGPRAHLLSTSPIDVTYGTLKKLLRRHLPRLLVDEVEGGLLLREPPGERFEPESAIAAFVQRAELDGCKLGPAVEHCRDWQEDSIEVDTAGLSVNIVSVDPSPVPKLRLLMDVLYALIEIVEPSALYWPSSECLTDPARMRAEHEDMPDEQWLLRAASAGAVNLWSFPLDGSTKLLLDTLGMAAFQLPDLETITDAQDPQDTALFLLANAACMLGGDVPEEGGYLDAPVGARWVCGQRQSSHGPDRDVIHLSAELS